MCKVLDDNQTCRMVVDGHSLGSNRPIYMWIFERISVICKPHPPWFVML